MTTVAQPAAEPAKTAPGTRIAAYQMADYLERLGVEVVFGLCGHTVIGMLDALGKSRIRFVSTRHEQIAAHAADGYARATGKPGVMLSHLGPGLTNAATGVANAALDSIPMVVIAGDVQSYFHGRHPHQEVNLHQDADQFAIYRPFCKRVYRVDNAADLPRVLERAFHLAQTGRPGPVLVDVPMDIFSADLPVDAFSKMPAEIARPTIDAATAARIVEALARAERPVLYAGGGVLSGRATAELAALAEALEVPVAHTLMGKGCLHEDHPLLLGQTGFWGLPVSNETCRNADVIVAIGTRLAEANSSSWDPRFTFCIPPTRLIHIDADAAEIGRNYPTELGVVADAKAALGALVAAAKGVKHRERGTLREDIARGRKEFAANWAHQWTSDQFPMRPERILSDLQESRARRRLHRDRRGLEQERRRPAVSDYRARHVHHAERARDDGLRSGRGPRRETRASESGGRVARRRRRIQLEPLGRRHRDGSRSAGGLAGDGQLRVRHDCGPRGDALRDWTFGCVFERRGEPYRTDYAAMARSFGARGVAIDSAGELYPALVEALASDLPTVIQAPMENAPTPTPGHWDINDVYRVGE